MNLNTFLSDITIMKSSLLSMEDISSCLSKHELNILQNIINKFTNILHNNNKIINDFEILNENIFKYKKELNYLENKYKETVLKLHLANKHKENDYEKEEKEEEKEETQTTENIPNLIEEFNNQNEKQKHGNNNVLENVIENMLENIPFGGQGVIIPIEEEEEEKEKNETNPDIADAVAPEDTVIIPIKEEKEETTQKEEKNAAAAEYTVSNSNIIINETENRIEALKLLETATESGLINNKEKK
jgi:hypothetical protein